MIKKIKINELDLQIQIQLRKCKDMNRDHLHYLKKDLTTLCSRENDIIWNFLKSINEQNCREVYDALFFHFDKKYKSWMKENFKYTKKEYMKMWKDIMDDIAGE